MKKFPVLLFLLLLTLPLLWAGNSLWEESRFCGDTGKTDHFFSVFSLSGTDLSGSQGTSLEKTGFLTRVSKAARLADNLMFYTTIREGAVLTPQGTTGLLGISGDIKFGFVWRANDDIVVEVNGTLPTEAEVLIDRNSSLWK